MGWNKRRDLPIKKAPEKVTKRKWFSALDYMRFTRDAHQAGRQFDRILQVAEFVHQACRLGLTSGKNTAVGEGTDLLDFERTAVGDRRDKLIMDIVQDAL